MRSNPLLRAHKRGGRIVVVGSGNLDFVISGGNIPVAGETVMAGSLSQSAGGKGLNQAVAAARAGSDVAMLASFGADPAGDSLVVALTDSNIDCSLIRRIPDVATGCAFVTVGNDSSNAISVVNGANELFRSLSTDESDAIRTSDAVLLQLELPLELVTTAARLAHENGALVFLTPAPAPEVPMPDELLECVDVILVNHGEALSISGAENASDALDILLQSVPVVIVTEGSQGCRWGIVGGERGSIPARSVEAIDSTGAGDTLAGYLAAGLVQGRTLNASLVRASVAASLTVQKAGGSQAIPSATEVDAI